MDVILDIIVVKFALESLTIRRLYNDIDFVHKLINGKLFCPEFLKKINFKISILKSINNGLS